MFKKNVNDSSKTVQDSTNGHMTLIAEIKIFKKIQQ